MNQVEPISRAEALSRMDETEEQTREREIMTFIEKQPGAMRLFLMELISFFIAYPQSFQEWQEKEGISE